MTMIKKVMKDRLGTILFMGIVIILIFWGVISVDNAKKNSIRTDYEYVPVEANVNFDLESHYKSVAKSEKLELFFDEGKGTIKVVDLANGYEWKAVVDDEVYDTSKTNKQWNSYLHSMFTISYNDLTKVDAPPAKAFNASDCDYMEVEYMENGVSVQYGFTEIGIFLNIEYLLEKDEFVVRIPTEAIEEQSKYAITTMEVLPYFGSAGNEIDGYFVYPDGSGAITNYSNFENRSANIKAGIWRTYSNKNVDLEEYLDSNYYERYTASIPIFGIKNNENALLAVFTEGAENTGIIGYPSGYVVNLNHIGFELYLRNVFDVDMFNVSAGDGERAAGKSIQRVDKNIINADREIRYFMFHGEDANYGKMADVYRNYLLSTNQLEAVIHEGDTMPLALDFLMGVTKEQLVLDEYITMTSLSNVQEILERLNSEGIDSTKIMLKEWQKGGKQYPNFWPVANQIGGKKGLKDLNEYLESHQTHDIYLENNFVFAIKEVGGFSATGDIVYSGMNLPISAGFNKTWFMFNPQVSFDRSLEFLDELSPYGQIGVAYEYLGRIVYPDYNSNGVFTRAETVNKWKEVFSNTKIENRNVAVEGMNQYAFTNVDYLYHVPNDNFGLSISDGAIPLLQMVISGLIPYSSDAGNLSYDLEIQKLKWIEFGSLPYFYLTNESSVNLRETESDDLFTSTYNIWEERVVSVYKEFAENFQEVYGQQMISHKILDKGIVEVGYSNGVKITLNYNEEEKRMNGLTIPAKDYIIVNGEGNNG